MHPPIIIGGGLTGLTLAHLLAKKGERALILEARDRLGGRILTTGEAGEAGIEMGATWLGLKHRAMVHLLQQLELPIFEQRLGRYAIYEPISTSPPQLVQLPPNDQPSYRIAGGTGALIRALAATLAPHQIRLGERVLRISEAGKEVVVATDQGTYRAAKVISTLPPYLLAATITCEPALPEDLIRIARSTQTWMGDSIKIGLRFDRPFWREDRLSGTVFSNVGPIPELYDHADYEDRHFALKGFLNGAYHSVSREARQTMVLDQLSKYYGDRIREYTAYEEAVWRQEPFTYAEYPGHVLPHQNNGNPIFRQPFWNGKLWIAGSETAPQFPGYMEGAVQSAQWMLAQL